MGYGEGEVTGRPGDGGIDGFINQDKLGLDKIFFQVKRFGESGTISASMIRDFIGTLEIKGVNKGVFITTSKFSRDAQETKLISHKNIILIDGLELIRLMINFNVGIYVEKNYEIKKIDSDFFTEE